MPRLILNMLIQLVIILLVAPLTTGIINKMKAVVQHRKGAPVFQLYFDLSKLLKKDMVISSTSSWIFAAAPYVYFLSVAAAFLFVPVIPQLFSFDFLGDAILAVYLLALGRFFITLSGLDTGSTFGGMGSSREMMISSLIEPSIIIVIFTLALNPAVGSTSFKAIYDGAYQMASGVLNPSSVLLLASLVIALLAETARIPVDDPATHLELTMVHEAMILEYSGRNLALIEYASVLKQLLFMTILANIFMPFGYFTGTGVGIAVSLLFFLLKIAVITVIIGLIEVNTVKLRLFSVPNLAAIALILALLGFMTGFVIGR